MTERISIQEYKAMTGKKNYRALGRLKSGEMNKTEKKFAAHLEARKQRGEILNYWFEPMNLKLAPKCFYKVDFMVLTAGCQLECHEVKGGYITDDAKVKFKVAANMYPFEFRMMQLQKKEWVQIL